MTAILLIKHETKTLPNGLCIMFIERRESTKEFWKTRKQTYQEKGK